VDPLSDYNTLPQKQDRKTYSV